MIQFDIVQLVPEFLRNDKNGYAIAKAIEAGLKYFLSHAQDGLDCLQNVDKMPEWRLDEMAWELNCLYDYNADVEAKRYWIKEAIPLFSAYGTPQAIYNFLNGYFDEVEVEENWQYHGEPYHFRVTVSGEWTDENERWARRSIEQAKNVRSILDNLAVGSGTTIKIKSEAELLGRFLYGPARLEHLAGTTPQENVIGRVTSKAITISGAETHGHVFPYPAAGTKPQENTLGRIAEAMITGETQARGHTFPYPAAGTKPQENTVGGLATAETEARTDGQASAFSYTLCAGEHPCGSENI